MQFKPAFGYINGRIEKFGKTYALGDELTIADLILAGAVQVCVVMVRVCVCVCVW